MCTCFKIKRKKEHSNLPKQVVWLVLSKLCAMRVLVARVWRVRSTNCFPRREMSLGREVSLTQRQRANELPLYTVL